jgi:hypothetical protein
VGEVTCTKNHMTNGQLIREWITDGFYIFLSTNVGVLGEHISL